MSTWLSAEQKGPWPSPAPAAPSSNRRRRRRRRRRPPPSRSVSARTHQSSTTSQPAASLSLALTHTYLSSQHLLPYHTLPTLPYILCPAFGYYLLAYFTPYSTLILDSSQLAARSPTLPRSGRPHLPRYSLPLSDISSPSLDLEYFSDISPLPHRPSSPTPTNLTRIQIRPPFRPPHRPSLLQRVSRPSYAAQLLLR